MERGRSPRICASQYYRRIYPFQNRPRPYNWRVAW